MSIKRFQLTFDATLAEVARGRTVFVQPRGGDAFALVPIPERDKHVSICRRVPRKRTRVAKRW